MHARLVAHMGREQSLALIADAGRRVLEPGAKLALAVWESLENSDAYPIEVELLERMAGPAAADALRAPFVLGDTDDLIALFGGRSVHPVGVRVGGFHRLPEPAAVQALAARLEAAAEDDEEDDAMIVSNQNTRQRRRRQITGTRGFACFLQLNLHGIPSC